MIRVRPTVCALALLVLLEAESTLVSPVHIWADGSLPPLPYRYLHPPAALAGSNDPPQDGDGQIPLAHGRSGRGYLFTRDGQAGIIVPAGALTGGSGVTSVHLHIQPVETPAGLPAQYTGNGNAYRFTATASGGTAPVVLAHPVTIELRWPHIPPALYRYRNGTWSRLCYSDQATFSPTSMSCRTQVLGTFVAVGYPSLGQRTVPLTPVSSTRWAFLNQYLAVIAALAVLVVAAVLGFLVSRPDKNRKTGRSP